MAQTPIPNNSLNQALNVLGTTINTITGKVNAGKDRVRNYKAQIIAKLKEVVNQLAKLKANSNLTALPELRKQLQDSQTALKTKTDELDQTKGELGEANQQLQQLQQNILELNSQIVKLNSQIEENNKEITVLKKLGQDQEGEIKEKVNAIQQLNEQVTKLGQEKADAEKNLLSAQQQIDSIIKKIGDLNTALLSQIGLIDTIAGELGDLNEGDVANQFNAVTENIKLIVDMLNNTGQGQGQTPTNNPTPTDYTSYNKFMSLNTTDKQKIIDTLNPEYQTAIENALLDPSIPVNRGNINNILHRLYKGDLLKGGKRKQKSKTMKKRHRKTMKKRQIQKGGYEYTRNKSLDNSSSVISSSDSSKSRSKSASNKRRKTKRRRRSSY